MRKTCPLSIRNLAATCASVILTIPLHHAAFAAAENTAGGTDKKSEFTEFSGLRSEILTMIGGATKKIWITTDFLTDGEIVSSLYIAQYRKVQINILLGRERATNILSRLSYLKQVNIPVALRPRGFYPASPTMMLIDDKLFSINSNLDYMAKLQRLRITQVTAEEATSYETSFEAAINNNTAPDARPLPQVGHAGGRKTRSRQGNGSNNPIQTNTIGGDKTENPTSTPSGEASHDAPAAGTLSADGAYRYRPVKDRPINGIPTKLPRNTIIQDRQRERARTTPTGAERKSESPPTAQ